MIMPINTILKTFTIKKTPKQKVINLILFFKTMGMDIAKSNNKKYAEPATHAFAMSNTLSLKIMKLSIRAVSPNNDRINLEVKMVGVVNNQ
jgi:hypothetical protein